MSSPLHFAATPIYNQGNLLAQTSIARGGHDIVVAPPKKEWAKGVAKKRARKVPVEGGAVSGPLHNAATLIHNQVNLLAQPNVAHGGHEIVVVQESPAPTKKGGAKGVKKRARKVPVREEDKGEKYWKYRKVNTPAAQKSRKKRNDREIKKHENLKNQVQQLKARVAELE